jgi:hypothetical protein
MQENSANTYESQFSGAPGPIVNRQKLAVPPRPMSSAKKQRPPTSPIKQQPQFIKKVDYVHSERKPIVTTEDIYARTSPTKKKKKAKKIGKSASKSALKQSPSTAAPYYIVYENAARSRSPPTGPRYVKVPLAESSVRRNKSPITVGPSHRAMKVSQYTEPRNARRASPGKYRNEELEQKTNLI